eukprot:GHRR01004126.1.p1 GENE.GHRR01004126.1~~GHRR01004126.1.p1  ORF type:complete len:157 (-),score=15.34 GHRR01004126.1:54-524(-)
MSVSTQAACEHVTLMPPLEQCNTYQCHLDASNPPFFSSDMRTYTNIASNRIMYTFRVETLKRHNLRAILLAHTKSLQTATDTQQSSLGRRNTHIHQRYPVASTCPCCCACRQALSCSPTAGASPSALGVLTLAPNNSFCQLIPPCDIIPIAAMPVP